MGKKEELDKQKKDLLMAFKNGIAKDVANFVFTKIEPFYCMDSTKVMLLHML